MGKITDKVMAGLPDPMVVSAYDGVSPSEQRAARRQVLMVEAQQETNRLLGVLIDLQRDSLDAGRLR